MASITRSDTLHCEKMAKRRARTFRLATYFLPANKRRGAFAVNAFCQLADTKASVRDLACYRRDLEEALEGRPGGPVLREIRWAVREFSIPVHALYAFIDATIANLAPRSFHRWDDLIAWCDEMASPVGAMYCAVLGIPGGPRQQTIALDSARTLGIAMQLTGILRDVGEHARDGRCYLPYEELSRFSLTREEVFENPQIARDPRWHRLMTFEIARARALYEQSLPGISMLAPDAQRCAAGCAIGYAAILDALEQIRYDSVSTRASVGPLARLSVMWDAWRYKAVG
jgi:phytoene synthase